MAFLCPVRIKRNKKKKPLQDESMPGMVPSMGRITGSASIETLVRVGIEKENGVNPESKMVVLHDFTPCVDDELEVKRGQIVHVLYQENDWVYVISEENREGFIPNSYCSPYGSQMAMLALNVRKKMPRGGNAGGNMNSGPGKATSMNGLPTSSASFTTTPNDGSVISQSISNNLKSSNAINSLGTNMLQGGSGSSPNRGMPSNVFNPPRSNSLLSETSSSQPDIHPFNKESSGRYVVLYTYQAQDENDLSVERGQCVTVLNSDDPDWYWISRYDQCEGFVPSGFIYPLDAIQRQQGLAYKPQPNGLPQPQKQQQTLNLGPPSHTTTTSSNSTQNTNNNKNQVFNPLNSTGNSSGPSSFSTSGVNSLISPGGPKNGLSPPPSLTGVSPGVQGSDHQGRYNGTELVMLYDYKAQAPDDLSVRRGDWVYADLSNQTVDGWLWSYAPKSRKYGFIPKAYARPPAMTSL